MSNADPKPQKAGAEPVKLSKREIEILELVREGLTSKTIATQLFISKRTVDFHLYIIYNKLQVANRLQACRRAAQLGILSTF